MGERARGRLRVLLFFDRSQVIAWAGAGSLSPGVGDAATPVPPTGLQEKPITTLLGLGLFVLLLAANALFVALEFALVGTDRAQLEGARREGGAEGRVSVASALVARLSFYLSGAQLGITLCSLAIGVVSEPVVAPILEGVVGKALGRDRAVAASVILALVVSTAVQMTLGELIPKNVAVARPLRTTLALARPAAVTFALLGPVIRLVNRAADGVVRGLGLEVLPDEHQTVRTKAELERLIRHSGEGGELEADHVAMLVKSIRFAGRTVHEVLTPRPEVVALPLDARGRDLLAVSAETGFSRFPVYGDDLDDIRGVVHAKNLLACPAADRPEVAVADLMGGVHVVPEFKSLGEVMAELRQQRLYMAVVFDEHGGFAGLLTVEDIVEEMIGEIDDEYDRAPLRGQSEAKGLVSGLLRSDEVEDAVGFSFPEGEYETLGGFLFHVLGRVPNAGERVNVEGWILKVERMDGRRIDLVRIRRARPKEGV